MCRAPSRVPGTILLALGLALGAAPALIVAPAAAQSLWMPRDRDRAVLVEALKPSFDGVNEDFFSFATFVGARSAPKSGISIVGEASLARLEVGTASSTSLGDVYIGAEKGSRSSLLFGELGVRIPTSSESEVDARLVGILSDMTRWEAFFSKTVSIQAAINARKVMPEGLFYRLRLSPVYQIPTESNGLDPELFAVYSGQIGMELPSVRMGVGIVARTLVSESDLSFSERTTTQGEAHADFGGGTFRPGIDVKTPLDSELNDLVPVIIGVSFGVSY